MIGILSGRCSVKFGSFAFASGVGGETGKSKCAKLVVAVY